jgi:hypothetical protein
MLGPPQRSLTSSDACWPKWVNSPDDTGALTAPLGEAMNVDVMHEIADLIEYTDRFDLRHFRISAGTWENVDGEQLWNDCGTVGCYAGWVSAWADIPGYMSTEQCARELGITYRKAGDLFCGWSDAYNQARRLGIIGASPFDMDAKQAAELLRAIADGRVTL